MSGTGEAVGWSLAGAELSGDCDGNRLQSPKPGSCVLRAPGQPQGFPGASETKPMQAGWCDSTRFLVRFQTQPGFSGYLPLLPLLHAPWVKPRGPLLPPWGCTLWAQASAVETMPPNTFTSKSPIQKQFTIHLQTLQSFPGLETARNGSKSVSSNWELLPQ